MQRFEAVKSLEFTTAPAGDPSRLPHPKPDPLSPYQCVYGIPILSPPSPQQTVIVSIATREPLGPNSQLTQSFGPPFGEKPAAELTALSAEKRRCGHLARHRPGGHRRHSSPRCCPCYTSTSPLAPRVLKCRRNSLLVWLTIPESRASKCFKRCRFLAWLKERVETLMLSVL